VTRAGRRYRTDHTIVGVDRFRTYDGTELAYRTIGEGPPLVCVPGGPGQVVGYLGDLGGLSAHRTLVLLHNRGTGASQVPDDPSSYRVDRLIGDVEALRDHLGLDRMDLLGHSAGGGLCLLYAAAHPDRLDRLLLVAPSLRAIGLDSGIGADEVLALRAGEPWYAEALAARAVNTPESWLASAPLAYGRWTDATRAHAAAGVDQYVEAATEGFYAGFEADPASASRLAAVAAPVLVLVGEYDAWPTRVAAEQLLDLFPDAEIAVQPEGGHFPWVDDPAAFTGIVTDFLSSPAR
jgi:pimeloyl-ACP methyl ester carboxylesterase